MKFTISVEVMVKCWQYFFFKKESGLIEIASLDYLTSKVVLRGGRGLRIHYRIDQPSGVARRGVW